MAGKIASDDLMTALTSYQAAHPEAKIEKVSEDSYMISEGGNQFGVELKDGALSCPRSQAVKEALIGAIMDAREGSPKMPVNGGSHPSNAIILSQPRKAGNGAMVKPGAAIRDIQVNDLSLDDIKNHICPGATDQEAFMFLKLCQARNLNPFTGEAYLVKYGQGKASMVVGKEAFTRKAEANLQFDGMEAGIIVRSPDSGPEFERAGSFVRPGESLIGGWARVYRKDRKVPFYAEVSLGDYRRPTQSGKAPWDTMPAVMIRKVALVSALREAFPSDLSGCYDSSEMGLNPENEISEAA